MKQFLPRGLFLFAGMLGIATANPEPDKDLAQLRKKFDLRESVLRRYFRASGSPAESYAGVFIAEADAHRLDWRLLPSLAVVETGAGRQARGNNLFGWNNGDASFQTVTEAIHHVAESLDSARAYKDKDLNGKLKAYNNEQPGYRQLVTWTMRRISPSVLVEAGN